MRVLIIEDDEDCVAALQDILTGSGYEITAVSSGREGLHIARSFAPDVIILDIAMQEMDGFEFRKCQLRDPALRTIPVIVTSGLPRAHIEGQLDSEVYFLLKPYDITGLLGILESVTGQTPPKSFGTRMNL